MKKRNRKAAVKALDKVFGDYIKKRDKGTCIVCGSRMNIQCGHLFTRVAYSTRWDEENGWAQCAGCNMRHEYDWKPMQDAVARKGIDVDALYVRHKRVAKFTTYELEEMVEWYKRKKERVRG